MLDRVALIRLGAFLLVSAPSWILLLASFGVRLGTTHAHLDATAGTLFALLQLGIIGVLQARGDLFVGGRLGTRG